MTVRHRTPLLLALPLALLGAQQALAERLAGPADQPVPAQARAGQPLELAQRSDQPWGGRPKKDDQDDGDAKQKPLKRPAERQQQKQRETQQGRDKAIQDRKDAVNARQKQADEARQKALQQHQEKQRDAQQAREKAMRDRQDALNAKQKQADEARRKALQQQHDKQRAADQAREKAMRDRQDALNAKQKQADEARRKALQQQQEKQRAADQAREKAMRDREDAADKAARGRDAAGKGRRDTDTTSPQDRRGTWGGTPSKAFDRKAADDEFKRARERAQEAARDANKGGRDTRDRERLRDNSAKKFESIRNQRKEETFGGGKRRTIIEPDKRVIVRQNDRSFIRHDETSRFQRTGKEMRRERRKDGLTMIVTAGLAGALIYSLQDDHGRLVRRSRREHDGREVVLIDNGRYYDEHYRNRGPDDFYDNYVDLPPPRVSIPRDSYIVDYERASQEDIYDALSAPPVERLERRYSLDQVRQSYPVLERMRRVDLDAINFDFGAWDVGEDQYPKLERIAKAMRRIVDRSPDEMFLIEGHTDAVGSDIDNLSLSDRRAETVAIILSDAFGVPPENLTTQGYGEQYLKVMTQEPSRANRRVSVRRITPLLSREGGSYGRDYD